MVQASLSPFRSRARRPDDGPCERSFAQPWGGCPRRCGPPACPDHQACPDPTLGARTPRAVRRRTFHPADRKTRAQGRPSGRGAARSPCRPRGSARDHATRQPTLRPTIGLSGPTGARLRDSRSSMAENPRESVTGPQVFPGMPSEDRLPPLVEAELAVPHRHLSELARPRVQRILAEGDGGAVTLVSGSRRVRENHGGACMVREPRRGVGVADA